MFLKLSLEQTLNRLKKFAMVHGNCMRVSDRHAGIRETPYAPFVKLCDRLANMTHCFNRTDDTNRRMHQVYAGEWTHFIQAITIDAEDKRFLLPQNMIDEVHILLSKDTL